MWLVRVALPWACFGMEVTGFGDGLCFDRVQFGPQAACTFSAAVVVIGAFPSAARGQPQVRKGPWSDTARS